METKTKRNLVIWSIILLVLLNISSLATIWYHRYQFDRGQRMERTDRPNERRHNRPLNRMRQLPPYLSGSLDLSIEQQVIMDSVWQYYNQQRLDLEESMADVRAEMFEVMMQKTLDSNRYNELSEEQSSLLRELNFSMLEMNRTIRSQLTEAQQELLRAEMTDIRQRMPHSRRHRLRK